MSSLVFVVLLIFFFNHKTAYEMGICDWSSDVCSSDLISAAHVFDLVERSDFVETSSGLLLANGVGAVAGPLAAAFFMRNVGPQGLFMATGQIGSASRRARVCQYM